MPRLKSVGEKKDINYSAVKAAKQLKSNRKKKMQMLEAAGNDKNPVDQLNDSMEHAEDPMRDIFED